MGLGLASISCSIIDACQVFGPLAPPSEILVGLKLAICCLSFDPVLTLSLSLQLPADHAVTQRSSWLSALVILVSCCLPPLFAVFLDSGICRQTSTNSNRNLLMPDSFQQQ